MKTIYLKNRAEWRAWLLENHNQFTEIWLVYYKKDAGKPSIDYDASVEEALCFGWIDSIIKKLDEEKYVRKFTPRKDGNQWSELNKKRVEKILCEGLMTEHGMKKIEAARQNGSWDQSEQRPVLKFDMLPEFAEALQKNKKAKEAFNQMAWTHQKQYLGWIESAKRRDTVEKRISESISRLEQGEKLGLK